MNSKDRKGAGAHVKAWVEARYQQPNGSTCQVYLGIAGITLLLAFICIPAGGIPVLVTLLIGFLIASMAKHEEWKDEKLLALRNALLRIAFEECRCGSKSHCHCHVWLARAVLDEDCPGAIETEIRERLGEYRDENDGRWVLNNLPFIREPIPEDLDLTVYVYPSELEWHRANGQLPEAHQASPQ